MFHPSMTKNVDITSYCVTKHAWKGNYKRLLIFGSLGVTTYQCDTLKVTNQWPYNEICGIEPDNKAPRTTKFVMWLREPGKKSKKDMRFSSEHKVNILSDALEYSYMWQEKPRPRMRVSAKKYRWNEKFTEVILEVNGHCISQVDARTNKVLSVYLYKDIDLIAKISDNAQGFVVACGGFNRLHLFYTANRDEFIRMVAEEAINKMSLYLQESKDSFSLDYCLEHRMGKYSQDEHVTSHAEFLVQKVSVSRHGADNPVQRILCLTETCLVERDPETYILVTLRPLCDIFALIRHPDEPQKFTIEYVHGLSRVYLSTDRDSLLASLLDGVRSSGNRDVCVKMRPTERYHRFGPLVVPVEEEVESQHMKLLQLTPAGMSFNEVVIRFNANVSYSGLLHAVTQEGLFAENKERLIKGALNSLINREGNQCEISSADLEAQFHALRRLVASKVGFQSFTQLNKMRETLGRKVVIALRRNDEAVAHAAIDMINALIQPMHENYDIRQEQMNKASIMSNSKFLESLLDMFSLHVLRGTGALVISVMLDFLTFSICPPYCETSDGEYFDILLKLVANRGRVMFKLFHHPSMAIVKGAGLIVQAIIDEADPVVGDAMQSLALAEGALPQHLLNASFARNNDHRSLAFRQLNRLLVSLWVSGNTAAKDLLRRVLPPGLILYLDSSDEPPIGNIDHLFVRDNLELAQSHMNDIQRRNNETWRLVEKKIDNLLTHWRSKIGLDIKPMKDRDEKPVCLRKRRRRVKVIDNWKMFYYQFYQEHAKPNLIWNMKTREEFRETLEKEISDFKRERDFCSHIEIAEKTDHPDNVEENSTLVNERNNDEYKKQVLQELLSQAAKVSWNYVEFKVIYHSLENEIKVGDYYLRLLLDEDERVSTLAREKDKLRLLESNNVGGANGDNDARMMNNADAGTEGSNGVESDNKSEKSGSIKSVTSETDLGAVAGVIKIRQSYEFFHDLYRRFLQYHKMEMRCMCLYAMSIVYGRCYKEVGPVNDCELFISLLERSNNKTERDRILLLLEKLILNKKNIEILIDANVIRVLIDLVTIAHLHISRAHMPQQSNVIEAAKDARSREDDSHKEWYYQAKSKEQTGPISFPELGRLLQEGAISPETKAWAQGLDQWRPLSQIPQAKWSFPELSTGQAVLTDSEVSAKILSILVGICKAYPSKDHLGGIIRPMPRCKKQITQPSNLAHLVQLLLTFDPVLVERVAILLNFVFDENPYRSRLYITGAFYFILMYMGSNVLGISEFLKMNHGVQAFRTDEQSNIISRSILGNVLPEAMVCFLENHPFENFAQIFLGEYDTPETIWNTEMRRFMIEKICCHLMEFSPRLPTNNRAIYQYLAMPVIIYPQLEHELFCGSYYLRHLCDTVKFPDWPIRSPVSLLRDILQAWKNEVEKKPPAMSVRDAYEILGLKINENSVNDQASKTREETLIRKAYYQLSMKFHPDKNPDGREMFEKVNTAYQFLCNRAKLCAGPDPKNIYLLLRSQSILFQRCRKEIEMHKYSGYPMLIQTIISETDDDQLFQKETPLLAACAELAYHTVNTSALNAEELRRQEGIQALQAAFSRCVTIITTRSTQADLPVRVCGYVTIFFSVASQFEACRQRMTEIHQIVRDLMRLLYFKNLPQLCTLTARCVADFCADVWLQTSMFENGALFHLLPFVFNYDFTLEEGGVARSEENHKQEIMNRLALIAILAVARLSGSPNEESHYIQNISADNQAIRHSLASMLTPYIQRKISEFKGDLNSLKVILKLLNSNSESPYLLWDNRTRSELKIYLESQQESLIKTSECDGLGAEFKYSLYQKELIVGEVFVRLYNEQKTFPLENPRSFTIDLLLFLKLEVEFMESNVGSTQLTKSNILTTSKAAGTINSDVLKHSQKIQSALEALVTVITNNPGVDIQLIGHFKMLFSLMTYRLFPAIQQSTVEVVKSITSTVECLEDIGASNVLVHLVRMMEILQQNSSLILDTISRVTSVTSLLKELVYRGCLIYTLAIFCNSQKSEVRVQAAALLGRMMTDKLVGNRIKAILLQFLPLIFLDAMKDNPESCIHLFDNRHENPELIWNDDTRQLLSAAVNEKKSLFFEEQEKDLNKKWSVPEDFRVQYDSVINTGLCLGGVYLHLYVANPGWVLRNPDEFCNQVFMKWFEIIQKCNSARNMPNDQLETITDALAHLLNNHPGLLDSLSRKGYVHKVFQTLNDCGENEPVLKAGLLISHQMANSKLCVSTMSSIETIKPLMVAMKIRQDHLGLAGETLFRLFQTGSDELVAQAIKAKLVEFVLSLLESGLPTVKDSGQVKAYLVKALKAMQRSPTFSAQITTMLENSSVWSQFRDQSHDLYLTNTPQVAGYLTGRSVDTAGYLTSFAQNSSSDPR